MSATPALAVWEVRTTADPKTKQTRKEATVANEAGHSLAVFRGSENVVWMTFSLNPDSRESLNQGEVFAYAIDEHDPIEENVCADPGPFDRKDFCVDTRMQISVRIWHGLEKEGRSPELKQLMTGSNVEVRYQPRGGANGVTRFSLEGAGPAIATALRITERPDPVIEAASEAMRELLRRAMAVCDKLNRPLPCLLRIHECNKEANLDPRRFEQCLRTPPAPKR